MYYNYTNYSIYMNTHTNGTTNSEMSRTHIVFFEVITIFLVLIMIVFICKEVINKSNGKHNPVIYLSY